MSKRLSWPAMLLLLLGTAPPLAAATAQENRLRIPRVTHALRIDGVPDGDPWEREAVRIENFLQFTPVEKGRPTEKTVAHLGFDEKKFYLSIRCFDAEPEKLRASITSRDNIFEDDWVTIFLDTFNEKRRAFAFFLNPFGIQMDAMRLEEGGNDDIDPSWDTVFYSAGRIDDQGYYVEMAVPFKSLRFPDADNHVWGITLARSIARKGEIQIWPPMSRDQPGLLCQAEEMSLPGKLEKGKNFEVMPIFTSLKNKGEKIDAQPGLNFKWGISSDLTVDLTVNPDFSQIEADAPQIDFNQRFALYYPEKRPFFLEGSEIFPFPEIQMIYTRRIIDPLAGAKLTGKAGAFTYGFLSALDTNPTESLWEVHEGGAGRGRNALFNIFRLKADVLKESYLGFALTDKEINGASNRVAGLDGQFKFKRNFFFSFQALASQTRSEGESSDISPALYGSFGYSAKYWGGGLYWMSIHPEFEAAGGFVNRTDYRTYGGYTYASLYPQKRYFNQLRIRLRGGRRLAFDLDEMQDEWLEASANLRFTEFSNMEASFRTETERYEGLDFQKNSFSFGGELQFISWLPLGFGFETGDSIYYDPDDPFLGYSNAYRLSFTLKPDKRLRVSMSFSKETFWEKWGGDRVFDYNVLRTRTTYQISRTLSLRAIVDYNHFYKQFYGSFLFSYILKPGTVFFFGIDNDFVRDDFGGYRAQAYSVFLKFSYWHRL